MTRRQTQSSVVVRRGEPGVADPRPGDREHREREADRPRCAQVALGDEVRQLVGGLAEGDHERQVVEQLERRGGAVRLVRVAPAQRPTTMTQVQHAVAHVPMMPVRRLGVCALRRPGAPGSAAARCRPRRARARSRNMIVPTTLICIGIPRWAAPQTNIGKVTVWPELRLVMMKSSKDSEKLSSAADDDAGDHQREASPARTSATRWRRGPSPPARAAGPARPAAPSR